MSVIEYANERGEIRYQPAHPDGRRLTISGWEKPSRMGPELDSEPVLYRSKRRASRKLSRLVAAEEKYYTERFMETK